MRPDRSDTVLLGAVLLCCCALTIAKAIQKREISPDMLFQAKDKRPFCNAFTGCGRKRSDLSLLEEAAGGPPQPPAGADSRLWEDLLATLLRARQEQAAPQYYRGRRSVPEQAAVAPVQQVNEPRVAATAR
ncbi:cardioactive peptide-like [Amphibalanus amphitrite]|uniref:cardioactive peptide-like n=1 Tax=Amphibalanus amphitrite TaxID=1232801 RepID=UPI001C923CC4|nr:cardioactive peptide-like [Amphibalanus amphitrite]